MGLTAGLSPGPLLTLVIAESLQHGIRAGIKVALAPLLSDAPIIVLTVWLVGQLSGLQGVLALLSVLGSAYILHMAYATARSTLPVGQVTQQSSASIRKGVLTNVLSPHPYLFWLTVGATTLLKASAVHALAPVLFMLGFYLPLVGSKVVLAVLVGQYRHLLSERAYRVVMRTLALLLALFAGLVLLDGLQLLGLYGQAPLL